MNKKLIRLTEQDLHNIVRRTVKSLLKEDYNGNYAELIKNEMHNMSELERQVPECYRAEIHSIISTLQGILSDIRTRDSIAAI